MFKRKQNETQEEFDKRMDRRMELLFPTMTQEIKKPKLKNLPLGKSIYDDDVDDDIKFPSLDTKNMKSELDALFEMPKSSTNKNEKAKSSKEDDDDEYLNSLYPSMKDLIREKKEKKGGLTGGAAKMPENTDTKNSEQKENNDTKNVKIDKVNKNNTDEKVEIKSPNWKDDKDFNNVMKYLYPQEGGYSNRKEDLGGPTKLGVTQGTFDWYNKKHNLPHKDVKNITKEEAQQIYHEYFWKQSGASNIKDKKTALMYFDAAVNHGPYYAKKYYKESNGDFDKFMQLRREHYKRMADNSEAQKKNYKGWMNRLDALQDFAEKNYK